MTTGSAARRLDRVEQAIAPGLEPIHILRLIIAPTDADMITKVLAWNEDGRSLTTFIREPGESKDALCERAARAMGWHRVGPSG